MFTHALLLNITRCNLLTFKKDAYGIIKTKER